MTVTSTNQKVTFNGDGSTTVFAYNYKIFAQTDLLVILRVTATGTETTQSLTTHYTVSGVGTASGGNVTMGAAPASGTTLTILRVQPNLQGLDLVPNDPFPAGNLEASLDKLTFMVQTHEEEIGRSIKASKANTITTTDFTISATDRANKVFAFDSSGDLSVTQELGIFRGNWAASTAYAQRDLVKDTSTANIFIVNTAHTSSGSQPITTNTDAAKYDLIVDAASATTSKTAAASSATAAANSATASASSATTSGNSATASANSATTSGNSATTSGNSATASGNSATASANSATAAASSATASANSATSAAASAADVAKVQGITNGTIAANKAVVVDANKDASSFRNLTATGAVTAGSLVIGSADIAEAELEMLDGITAGTALASKAMVLDSAKDISGGRNLTITGELDAATGDFSGAVDVAGALTISTDATVKTADGALLLLQSSDTTITDGSVLGGITFNAPNEASGTDALLVGAAIEAVAEGTFAADNNATELVFKTGASEAATTKMTLTSGGHVGIGTSSPNIANFGKAFTINDPASSNQIPAIELAYGSNTRGANIAVDNRASSKVLAITAVASDLSMTFGTNNTERMRLTNAGDLLLGKTSASSSAVGVQFEGGTGQVVAVSNETFPLFLNRLSTDGSIADFRKDGTSVGTIGTAGGQIHVASTGGATYTFENGALFGSDEDRDLGKSNRRFKDIYLSGGAFIGGTGAANKLDDVEEGSFTPTAKVDTLASPYGSYTKVGRLVTLCFGGVFPNSSSGFQQGFASLPFSASSGTVGNGGGFIRYSTFVGNQPYLYGEPNTPTMLLYRQGNGHGFTAADASGLRLDAVAIYYTA